MRPLLTALFMLCACGPASPGEPGGAGGGAGVPTGVPVRFLALGDTGKGNDGQARVAAGMARKCAESGCDFALLLGDNVYPSGVTSADDPLFESRFEQPYRALDIPFFAVLGNHDYGAGGAGTSFWQGPYEVMRTQRSAKWRMPAEYYRVRFGDVELFALDTNLQQFSSVPAQRAAVKGWLAESTAPWKVALGHHPYRSNGRHGNAGSYDGLALLPVVNGDGVRDFYEDVVCGKVDLLLSGHDHNRQWLDVRCRGTELAVSGAGAEATALKGNNPALFEEASLGFLWVEIIGATLRAEFLDADGSVEFTRVLTKE